MRKIKSSVLLLALVLLVSLLAAGCGQLQIQELPAEEEYTYENPQKPQAIADDGFVIDGVLEEAAYTNNNWLYLSNREGNTDVQVAATSYFSEKGMYFAFDVTESNPIYVNPTRASYLNSGLELHLAPSKLSNMKGNSVFEINLLPNGDMTFKKSNGKGEFVNVATSNDIMAVLGATTKGELNTEDCYGYTLELYIPWGYMEKFDLDVASMRDGYVYAGIAHITSFNYVGTNMNTDRYWYSFDQQHGASWSNVYQYFRFDSKGALGTVPVTLQEGAHYTIEGATNVIPGMQMNVTVTPEEGYVLSSIMINGEEYIGKVNHNADGSVTICERGVRDGVTIAATAIAADEGNKTLTGTVIANKLGGGDLQNISASYKGPAGEKLLELDSNGKFKLTDLQPGSYTILLEKAGYKKFSRTVYVGTDMDLELSLEYDLFASTGYGWVLDQQNDGVLYKFGGQGELLTNDTYKQFTVSANFKFDTSLETVGTANVFTQQRQGLKIVFSNGKIWHIDLLKEDGKYKVQYAKHTEDSLFGWKTIYTMTQAEVNQYTGQDGIRLSVQRAGRYANVYLGNKLVGQEILDAAYAGYTAQIGFEAWLANRQIMAIPYSIVPNTGVNLHNTFFKMKDGWDVSNQYSGTVTKVDGGSGRLTFVNKFVNMNLTVTARDYDDAKNTAARTDILFVFENGKQMSFGIDGSGKQVQSMYDAAAADKYINTGWKSWGKLTDAEVALLQGDGLSFKVVRYGTEVTLYVGDRMVAAVDLTANNSGVTANMAAEVSLRHYDDAGVQVKIPFKVSNQFDLVKVSVGEGLTAEKQNYFTGDTVNIRAENENNNITALAVNGQSVPVPGNGVYSFQATEKEYTVTGNVARSIFKPDDQWNLMQQHDGILSIPQRTGNYASLYTTDAAYRDVAVTIRDLAPQQDAGGKGNFQMQLRFIFANGKEYQIRLHNTNKLDTYEIQSMGGTNCITGWKWHVNLTQAQVTKLRSEGIQFRVALVDTNARIYLDGKEVAVYDLSAGGLTTDMTAQIRLMMYGNQDVENIVMPYVLGAAPKLATVTVDSGIVNGTITTDKKENVFVAGERITLLAAPQDGYDLVDLTVKKNGQLVELELVDGGYSFVAEEGSYTVEAKFATAIFNQDPQWDLSGQYDGTVSIPQRTGNYASLYTAAKIYREVSVTVSDLAPTFGSDGKGNFQMQIRFIFANGKEYQIRLHNTDADGRYKLQNMGGTNCVTGWKWLYDLTAEQTQLLQSRAALKFGVSLVGSTAKVFLGDVQVASVDLSGGGVTADATAQIRFVMYGNNNVQNLEIPFTLGEARVAATVQAPGSIAGGSVTADKTEYVLGETVTLKVAPAEGYYLKSLTVKKDGQPVEVTPENGNYTFSAESGAYTVEAEFAESIFSSTDSNNTWDLSNQYGGVISILNKSNKTASVTTKAQTYSQVTVTVRDHTPSLNADNSFKKGNFSMEVYFIFADGKEYQVRLHNTDSNGLYKLQNMGNANSLTGWKWQADLTTAQANKVIGETGVEFTVKLVGSNIELWVDGVKMKTVALDAKYSGQLAKIKLSMGGNNGVEQIDIPFTLG